MKKAKYLADVLPASEMYNETPATMRMRHCLSLKYSARGESHVESAQGQQQHYANVGMRDEVAEQYILRGHARANLKMREKAKWNDMEGWERESIPVWLRGVPFYHDEHHLGRINEQVERGREGLGSSWVPFPDVKGLPDNNGERFLGSYFNEQKQRGGGVDGQRCPCGECANNIVPLSFLGGGEAAAGTTAMAAAASVGRGLAGLLDGDSDESDGNYFNFDRDDDEGNEQGGYEIGKRPIGDVHQEMAVKREEDAMAAAAVALSGHNLTPRMMQQQMKGPPAAMMPWNVQQQQQHTMGGQMGMPVPWGMQPMAGQPWGMQPMQMMNPMLMQQQQMPPWCQPSMQQTTVPASGRPKKRSKFYEECCLSYVHHRKAKKAGRPKHDEHCPLMTGAI